MKLILGRIKKLYIKVPWNALSSKPVTCEVSGLELVISPLERDLWQQLVLKQNRFEALEATIIEFAKQTFLDILEEERKQLAPADAKGADQSGFMMNLTTKIIDNMQINITNIHVRYEDTKFFKKPLSMGVTLQRLQIHTTDEKWKEAFFDRTLEKNKKKPIQKMFKLSNCGFYCNPKDADDMMVTITGETSKESKLKTLQKQLT